MSSTLGWILACIFAAFVIIAILVVVLFPQPTPPTRATTAAGMLSLQRPAQPVSLVLGAEPAGVGDAGDDYWNAFQACQADEARLKAMLAQYTAIARGQHRLSDSDVAWLEQLAEPLSAAAERRRMSYYFRLTPKTMEIPYDPPEARKFQELAQVPQLLAAHYFAAGEAAYPKVERRLFDMFVMGWHLMNERARLDLVRTGLGLQDAACDLLAQLYAKWNKPDRLQAVRSYKEGLLDIKGIYSELYGIIWQLSQQPGGNWGPHPGDIFNLAEHHADRAVRVEATLVLGVVKLTAFTRGDRRYVSKLIRQKLASEDPIEQVAGRCAKALDNAGLQKLVNTPPGG